MPQSDATVQKRDGCNLQPHLQSLTAHVHALVQPMSSVLGTGRLVPDRVSSSKSILLLVLTTQTDTAAL